MVISDADDLEKSRVSAFIVNEFSIICYICHQTSQRASTNLLNSYVLQSNCQLSTLNCQLSTAITPSTLVVVGCVAAGNFPLRRRYSRATHPTFLTPSAAKRTTATRLTRIPAATKTRTSPLLPGI